ncbi:DUF3052 domain-containing protein [uncultured Dokdonia sp.]|uniref:DUF3052 domain-containing protein n=1 Tax=uncultured Dokdonia sp. TaxID=575653 RepID=UPI002604DEC0|nr:DUF3052 domain-containing protein [uncultured Dokdonia sp.]
MTSGYSGTPLAKKLGIKEGYTILLFNAPQHYFDLFTDLPKKLQIAKKIISKNIDFNHLFCTTLEELQNNAITYKKALKKNGLLWVSWPKGASSIPTDLKREPIRDYLLSIGLLDVKVAAIDKDWSALKFVYRLKDR